MQVRVECKKGKNPRVYNTDTNDEITDDVREIRILPLRKAVAIVFDRDTDGNKYVVGEFEEAEVATFDAEVVRIEGVWTADERP